MIATDSNTKIVSYIAGGGARGRFYSLLRLAVDLFLWLHSQNIVLRARHIAGCLSVITDHLFRPSTDQHEMRYPSRGSSCGLRIVGSPHIGHVHHSPQFSATPIHVSDSGIWGLSLYMFLPFTLLNKVRLEGQDHPNSPLVAFSTSDPAGSRILIQLCVDQLSSFRTVEAHCLNLVTSRIESCAICMHAGSHAVLPSSRVLLFFIYLFIIYRECKFSVTQDTLFNLVALCE